MIWNLNVLDIIEKQNEVLTQMLVQKLKSVTTCNMMKFDKNACKKQLHIIHVHGCTWANRESNWSFEESFEGNSNKRNSVNRDSDNWDSTV